MPEVAALKACAQPLRDSRTLTVWWLAPVRELALAAVAVRAKGKGSTRFDLLQEGWARVTQTVLHAEAAECEE
eukprot:9491875-Lingulodinium_polyedra.AAC.1